MSKRDNYYKEMFSSPEYEKKLITRAELIQRCFDKFKKNLFKHLVDEGIITHDSGLFINSVVLIYCVDRYFKDIEAERARHVTDNLFNGYRQAAFIIKWLVKLRPIITATSVSKLIDANDEFAYQFGLALLKVDVENVDPAFKRHFIYSLKHGDISEGMLLSLCVLLNPLLHEQQMPFDD